jgi:hypothetical protein
LSTKKWSKSGPNVRGVAVQVKRSSTPGTPGAGGTFGITVRMKL